MKPYPLVVFLSVAALVPNLHAQSKIHKTSSHAATRTASQSANAAASLILNDGRLARIENGRVMIADAHRKYVAAPAGRYTTREGKLLLVGNEGHLNNSTTLQVEVAPQPEVKRTVPSSNGRYHQTGSNL